MKCEPTPTPRKRSGNSLLQGLPPEIQAQLWELCEAGGSYADCLEWLERDVFQEGEASSISSLQRWRVWYAKAGRFVQSEGAIDAAAEWAKEKLPGLEPEKLMDMLSMMYLSEMGAAGAKPLDFVRIAKFVQSNLKNKEQKEEARRKLEEAGKVDQADTPQSRADKLRAIFGR